MTGSDVAVKVLDPHAVASPNARKRFLREVQTASALAHPHVVEVLGHGETPEGGAYLVMERLVGKTLAARLRESGPLPQPRAIHIVAQVLDAMRAAHRIGIVHRDVKPSNVMLVERDGDPDFVKMCDFGLAKDIERDSYDPVRDGALAVDLVSVTTEHGHICGTPEYMAPEQARGDAVDERADLYAVAAMLFHAVVGRTPFSAKSPLAVVSLHLTAAPPRPSALRPDLEIFPPLESLILRGLAKDRAERPSSAEVFRTDLLRIRRDHARWVDRQRLRATSGIPIDSATLTLAPATARSRRAWSTGAALVSTSVAVLAILGTAAWRGRAGRSESSAHAPASVVVGASAATASTAAGELALAPAVPAVAAPLAPEPASAASAALEPRPAPRAPERASSKAPRPTPASTSPLASAQRALVEGRIEEACSLAEHASRDPNATSAVWKFLGQCFMRLGNRDKAIAYYRRYLEASPSGSDAVFVREMIK
jgi:serine/threonine-protein kinase